MQLAQKHKEYWQRNLRMTLILLAIWFVVTLLSVFRIRELSGGYDFWLSSRFLHGGAGGTGDLCDYYLVLR